jgi:glycogen debranching enzyme
MIRILEEQKSRLEEIISRTKYSVSHDLDTVVENDVVLFINTVPDKDILSRTVGRVPVVLYGRAVKVLQLIGIEEKGAIEESRVSLSDSPWDKRGFQSYGDHPLFYGLHGGFYSIYLNACEKMPDVFYYSGKTAKVVAVEKRYISYIRERALIWLHTVNGIPVLSIGGFLPLEGEDNPYRSEVERFVENTLEFMSEGGQGGSYWTEAHCVCRHVFFDRNPEIPSLSPVKNWPDASIHIEKAGGYLSTSGERLLANMSAGRIEEVWAHPFRILKYLEFSIDGKPLSLSTGSISCSPERVEFKLECGRMNVFSSLKEPFLFVQFDPDDRREHTIGVSFESDMRIMWPMDEAYSGDRLYSVFERGVHFSTQDGRMRASIVNSSPVSIEIGDDGRSVIGKFESRFEGTGYVAIIVSIAGEKFPRSIDMQKELEMVGDFYTAYLERGRVRTDDRRLDEALDLARVGAVKFRATTPGIGTGLMAGYASSRPGWFSARPGYAWYFGRDSLWCSLAFLDIGDFETVRENLELLIEYRRLDGKIYHELTSSGAVHYDAADSTPLFLYTLYRYARQTGDLDFVKKNLDSLRAALDYCAKTDSDGDGLIENTVAGHGWIEGGRLYGASASFYLNCIWLAALRGVGKLAEKLRDRELRNTVAILEEKAVAGLEKFHDPSKGYVLGIDQYGKRMPHRTVMASMGVIFDAVPGESIREQIEEFATDDFSTDWGVRIIGKSSGIFNPRGYHEGSVWPLFTGWAALAQFKIGADLDGYNHTLANLYTCRDFSGGYIPEVLNGETYGLSGVCPHQAWSETMGFHPFYEGVLGFEPDSLEEILKLGPSIPPNLGRLEARSLVFGDNSLDLRYASSVVLGELIGVTQRFELRLKRKVPVYFTPHIPAYAERIEFSVNGRKRPVKVYRGRTATACRIEPEGPVSGRKLEIEVRYGVPFLLMPVEPQLLRGKESCQPRIVSIAKIAGSWELRLAVPAGRSCIPFLASKGLKAENAVLEDGKLYVSSDRAVYGPAKVLLRHESLFIL